MRLKLVIKAWKLRRSLSSFDCPRRPSAKSNQAVMDGKKQVEIAEILNVTRQAVANGSANFARKGKKRSEAKRRVVRKAANYFPAKRRK